MTNLESNKGIGCPSLCIPRVVAGVGKEQVLKIIQNLHLGTIQRIDMIQKKTEKGEMFSRVFIHFSKWNDDSEEALQAKERILSGKDIKVIYDEPWFWKVSALRNIQSIKTEKYEQNRTRRPRSDAIVDEPRKHFPLAKGITRTISAEACGAYDYNRNGELVPYINKNASQNFIDTSSYLEPK
jgi:hypothetical protein